MSLLVHDGQAPRPHSIDASSSFSRSELTEWRNGVDGIYIRLERSTRRHPNFKFRLLFNSNRGDELEAGIVEQAVADRELLQLSRYAEKCGETERPRKYHHEGLPEVCGVGLANVRLLNVLLGY